MADTDRRKANRIVKSKANYRARTVYKTPWHRAMLRISEELPQYKAILIDYKGRDK